MDRLAGRDRSGDEDGDLAVELPAEEFQGECVSAGDPPLNGRERDMHKAGQGNIRLLTVAALVIAALLAGQTAARAASAARPAAVSCVPIKTPAQLQAMKNSLAASYCLANDIDMRAVANFTPVGGTTAFTGNFFGSNHTISNLTIKSAAPYIGLFGAVADATIQDVALVNVKVVSTSTGFVIGGGLVGAASGSTGSTISNISVSGAVNVPCTPHDCYVGGIAGAIGQHATLTDSRSEVNVTTSGVWVGGAVGVMTDATALVTRSSAIGNVSCPASSPQCSAGGLVGNIGTAKVTHSYATGNVTCGPNCDGGGLVGDSDGTILQSFATGAVHAGEWVGGLIGWNNAGTVQRSFAAGSVTGSGGSEVGGLIGYNIDGTLSELYAVGSVSGAVHGGLLGAFAGSPAVSNCYW
ncbi:MAG: GLUG motif-containing protein, partial [Pseudolabrys sp.]